MSRHDLIFGIVIPVAVGFFFWIAAPLGPAGLKGLAKGLRSNRLSGIDDKLARLQYARSSVLQGIALLLVEAIRMGVGGLWMLGGIALLALAELKQDVALRELYGAVGEFAALVGVSWGIMGARRAYIPIAGIFDAERTADRLMKKRARVSGVPPAARGPSTD